MAKKKKQLSQEEAKEQLWRSCILSWKLKGKQKDIYNHFKNNEEDISAVLISRRFGKTFTMCVLAIEECLRTPKAIVKYICPTSKMVVNVMHPTVRDIIEDCPEDIRPTWSPSEKKWKFQNGSEIQVAGTEAQAYNSIRGGYSNLAIVDEAGFCSELETVVYSVLAPTTDTTGGKIIMASTPNDKDANHEFHEHFLFPMEAAGKLLKMTWEDSPMIDDARRAKILKRYPGGLTNKKFRCEYLCEIPDLTDTNVVPEFHAAEDKIVKEMDLPDHCDFYVASDVGFSDLTVALFAYYDYRLGKLVVMDEYVINGPEMTTDKFVREVGIKEKMWFKNKIGMQIPPYLRVMDNNLLLINDISRYHKMSFVPTEKHNKEQAVDTVRRWVEEEKVIIHPRCKNLIYHVKYTQWHYTKQGTFTGKFKHLKGSDTAGLLRSHGDALDALIYLVRNVQVTKNPYPKGYGLNINRNTFVSPHYENENESDRYGMMKKLLNIKKK